MTHSRKKGFTLLELLIVITILAILTLVVVLFINPVEILKKSRDVQRMSDLDITRTAINLYLQDSSSNNLGGTTYCTATTLPAGEVAATSKTRSSLINATGPTVAAMGNLSLPNTGNTGGGFGPATFVTGTTTTDVANNNGKGWIPYINFGAVGSGAPISKLPVDPINTATAGTGLDGINSLYYRFGCKTNSTFELDSTLESDAYGVNSTSDNKAKTDGGNAVMRYEVGTDLNILPSTAQIL